MTLKMNGTAYEQVFPTTMAEMDCNQKYLVSISRTGRRPGPARRQPRLHGGRLSRPSPFRG